MKTTVFLLLVCLILVVKGEKSEPDFIYKAAAQICKQYFLQCKQNPKMTMKECFRDVYYGCIPTYREWFESVEQCASEAGDDFAEVMKCAKAFQHA